MKLKQYELRERQEGSGVPIKMVNIADTTNEEESEFTQEDIEPQK